MTIRNLYKYEDEHGTTITPNKRNESDEPYCVRLIADEGYILTDGTTQTPCVDTHEPEKWSEIEWDEPIPESEPEPKRRYTSLTADTDNDVFSNAGT